VGIVHRGRLVAYGTPADLTTSAAADVRFVATSGLDLEKLARAVDVPVDLLREPKPGEYVVDVAPTPVIVAALTAWLHDQDVLVRELRAGRGSLEDVFLRLTAEQP
jgi:ABC-2 type transport system ATP-binding protein